LVLAGRRRCCEIGGRGHWWHGWIPAVDTHVRLHDLRHVAQVYTAEAGATLPELMARLGHATPAAAMVYLHARAQRDTELVAALGAAMASASNEPTGAH
jgi:integrase